MSELLFMLMIIFKEGFNFGIKTRAFEIKSIRIMLILICLMLLHLMWRGFCLIVKAFANLISRKLDL